MSRVTWRSVLVVGAALAFASALFGEPFLSIGLVVSALIGITGLIAGPARWRAEYRAPWHGLAATIALFLAAAIVREVFVDSMFGDSLADVLDAAGYVSAIIAVYLLGRLRAHDNDPTNLIDALIVMGGIATLVWAFVMVPHLQDPDVSATLKSTDTGFSFLSLTLGLAVTRLAIGPGAKNRSYYLLALAAAGAFGSDLVASLEATYGHTSGLVLAADVFPQIAFVFLAAAALHPSMRHLTLPTRVPIGRMTTVRLAVMTAAVLVAPAALIFKLRDQASGYAIGLVACWFVLMLLVMARVAGLVRARERVAALERVLSRAAAGLVSATDREQMQDAAITAMAELVGDRAGRVRVSVASHADDGWTIAASHGHRADEAMHTTFDHDVAARALPAGTRAPVMLEDDHPLDLPDETVRTTVAAPLVSQNQLRGALLCSLDGPLDAAVVDAVGALAADVSLALESAALTEDLHRRRSQHRFQALVEHSSDVLLVVGNDRLVRYASPSVRPVLGYDPVTLEGARLASLVHANDAPAVHQFVSMEPVGAAVPHRMELRVRTHSDDWKTLDVTVTDLRHDPDIDGIVLNAHDVTERKALEEDLRHKALHDDLTGLANRVLFRERVDHALAMRRRTDTVTAVLFIDLDDFQTVNDGLGHDLGDELLKVVAFRLSCIARAGDTAARLGGDEFAILLEEPDSVEDTLSVARRVLVALEEPVEMGGREITVGASIGIALADTDADSSEVLLRNADVAMYHAKRTGKGRVRLFDEAMYVSAFERLELKADLAHALDGDELDLHYQPLVSLHNGHILGFEALLRWQHAERGMVSPASFIPIAEETGLIVPIGAWVLRRALFQLAAWRDATGLELTMSVNMSARQLEEDDIVDDVARALMETGVEPSWVTIELTESVVLEEGSSREHLFELRKLGVGIAADDFGTGFASYAALQQLPFTIVKIDRSLIMGLDATPDKALPQVRSIVEMAHATRLQVVAEGIEEDGQRRVLAELGCDVGQGYLLGRPTPADVAGALLSTAPAGRRRRLAGTTRASRS